MNHLRKRKLIQSLRDLVNIRSYEKTHLISDYVSETLKDFGFNPKSDRYGNVLLEIGNGKGFLLNAHLDTVKATGWDFNPYKAKIQDNRLYGRGASDCKAGVACMLEIAREIIDMDLRERLVLAFTAREEDVPMHENGAFQIYRKVKADRGLILESSFTLPNIVGIGIGCRGLYRCDLTVYGRQAHSGRPKLGKNSIYMASDFIREFRKRKQRVFRARFSSWNKPIESCSSVTQITAMEGRNVIPGECKISLDFRTVPRETLKFIRGELIGLCDNVFGNENYKITYETFYPADFNPDESFIKVIESSVKKSGLKPRIQFRGGRNDTTIFHGLGGISCMVLGPGTKNTGHTKHEYVDIKGFVKISEIVFNVVQKFVT